MTRRRSHYHRCQTKWTVLPAMIESQRGDTTIGVRIYAARRVADPPREPASIFLTPQEAQGFAAWLSEQAEHLTAKAARKAARAAARRVKP